MSVTGIVLAGGRSSRFGGPKLAAEIDGVSVLSRTIGSITSLADEILVAGPNLPTAFLGTDSIRLVPDQELFAGPLAALAGALRETGGSIALVVGGDMPRLVPEVLQRMIARLEADASVDAVLLERPGVVAVAAPGAKAARRPVLPFVCLVEPARTAATAALDAGDRSIRGLLDRLESAELPAAMWLEVDPDALTLLDVDTRSDLEHVRRHESRPDLPRDLR